MTTLIEMEPKSNKRQKKDGEANFSSQPTKHKQRKHFYIYGNYHTYYGYRIDQALDEDPRMKVLKKEWFEGRDCLDIGCNEGFITISIAQKFACRNILGIDIDDKLIGRARQNLKAMAGFEENGETIKQFAEERNKVNKLEDTYRLEQSNGYEDKSNEFIVTEREEQSSEDKTNKLGDADNRSLRDEVSQLFRGSGSDNLAQDKDRLNELEDMDMKGQYFEDKDVTKDLGGADSGSVSDGASQLLRGAGSDNLSEDKDRVNELESTDTTRRSFEDKVVTKDLKCTYRRFFGHGTKQMSRNPGSDNVDGKFKDTDLLERVRFRTENFIQKSPSVLDAAYDTVLCLSVTKWIHLNWGDEGLLSLFAKIWQILRPGGILLLEPQPWKSYERKRLVSEVAVENFREIIFKPDAFRDILLDKIGFRDRTIVLLSAMDSGSKQSWLKLPPRMYLSSLHLETTVSSPGLSRENSSPRTPSPTRTTTYGDRFIPSRTGFGLNGFALIENSLSLCLRPLASLPRAVMMYLHPLCMHTSHFCETTSLWMILLVQPLLPLQRSPQKSMAVSGIRSNHL